MLCRGATTKVAHWNPNLDFDTALDSLPVGVYLAALKDRIKPIISRIGEIERVEGQREIRHPVSHCRCRFMTNTVFICS